MKRLVRETAETVYAGYRQLDAKGREAVITKLLQDEEFRQDLLDIATIEKRRSEPVRSLREFLARPRAD